MEWGLENLRETSGSGNNYVVSSVKEVTEGVRAVINSMNQRLSDEEVLSLIEDFVLRDPKTSRFDFEKKSEIVDRVFNTTRKDLGVLQPLVDDDSINEIMVNGKDNIFIEKNGVIEKTNIYFEDATHLEDIIRRLSAKVHKEINELNPIVDFRLKDGSRVNAVYGNLCIDGPAMTIRKFPKSDIKMDQLIEWGTITHEAADYLKNLVIKKANIFISGGTSSGKTTFLNCMSNYINKNERVIVIEDSSELKINATDNIIRMETKQANQQGIGMVTMEDLIKTSLRMRPDRIIVGEVRGKEVKDMLQAMNTGHDGSLSTGHGNSPLGMLSRLETMYLSAVKFPIEAIRGQIYLAIDYIVHLGKINGNTRKVLEISELSSYKNGYISLNPIFKYDYEKNILRKTENEATRIIEKERKL